MTGPNSSTILSFLVDIGLPVIGRRVTTPTAVPAITIDHGALVVDPHALGDPDHDPDPDPDPGHGNGRDLDPDHDLDHDRGAAPHDATAPWPTAPRRVRLFSGDLLHEAGHLALLTPSTRAVATGRLDAELGAGYELGAICWSVAAAWHLNLNLDVVFHDEGYRGEGGHLAEVYRSGAAPGLPLLEWAGLTWSPGREPPGEQPFPVMRQWLRTSELATDGSDTHGLGVDADGDLEAPPVRPA